MLSVQEPAASQKERTGFAPSLRLGDYVFKRAETHAEILQVHRLNYRTFVDELSQHADPGADFLVDKFDHKNIYLVAIKDNGVVGMLAVHDQPPFSVADRLSDPAMLGQLGDRLLEVRLLAIEQAYRSGLVFAGLIWTVYEFARANGFSHVIGSGLAERLDLYERLGFRSLGPAVQDGRVLFVPMAANLEESRQLHEQNIRRWRRRLERAAPQPARTICLLPGPVAISTQVRSALAEPLQSHRDPSFIARFESVRSQLTELTGADNVALLCGSGTLANDAVAATLAADSSIGRGLLLSNGEFGERLARQAARFALDFDLLQWPWGKPWDLDRISDALERSPDTNWIWGVHLETSTGVLNDVQGLLHRLRRGAVRICLDCVSSLGAAPVDLSRVHLASASSGKALAGLAGLAIVFVGSGALQKVAAERLPTYLDVVQAVHSEGPRFTCSSIILVALERALEIYASQTARRARFEQYEELGRTVRQHLRALQLEPLAEERVAAPVITTFAPPDGWSVDRFLDACRAWGYELAGRSGYLRDRGLVQIATMGDVSKDDLGPLFEKLGEQ